MILFIICFVVGVVGVNTALTFVELMYGVPGWLCDLIIIIYCFSNLILCAYIRDLKDRARRAKVCKKKWKIETENELWQKD